MLLHYRGIEASDYTFPGAQSSCWKTDHHLQAAELPTDYLYLYLYFILHHLAT